MFCSGLPHARAQRRHRSDCVVLAATTSFARLPAAQELGPEPDLYQTDSYAQAVPAEGAPHPRLWRQADIDRQTTGTQSILSQRTAQQRCARERCRPFGVRVAGARVRPYFGPRRTDPPDLLQFHLYLGLEVPALTTKCGVLDDVQTLDVVVELRGLEPLTPTLPGRTCRPFQAAIRGPPRDYGPGAVPLPAGECGSMQLANARSSRNPPAEMV